MSIASEGWALELRGEQFDLDDLREALKPPFDPWVEEYADDENSRLLLRSRAWADMQSTGQMMADARRLIDQMNGAHLVDQSDARPISHGITLRFRADGTRIPVIFAASMHITLQGGRCRARGVVGNGQYPAEPVASPMQQRLERASSNGAVADLLTFVTRADNWFDLFKGMESVERLIGGVAKAKALAPDWSRVRQTANCHRHAPSPNYPLPKQPASIPEARALLFRVAGQVL